MAMRNFILGREWVLISDGEAKLVQIKAGDVLVSKSDAAPAAGTPVFNFNYRAGNNFFSFDESDVVYAKSGSQTEEAQITCG